MPTKPQPRFLARNNSAFRRKALSSALRQWAESLLKEQKPHLEAKQPGFGWYGLWLFQEPQEVDGKTFTAAIVGKDNQGISAQVFSTQDEAEEIWAELEDAMAAYKSKAAKKTADSFMQEQVVQGDWIEVDGPAGTEWVEADLVDPEEVEELKALGEGKTSLDGTELGQFTENKTAVGIEIRKGWWGARLSAPGYMDRTEWTVFETEEEAREFLKEFYGEDEDLEAEASLKSKKAQEDTNGTVRKFPEYKEPKYEAADPEEARKEGESMDDYIERLRKLEKAEKKESASLKTAQEDSTEALLLEDLKNSVEILENMVDVLQSFVTDIKGHKFDQEEMADMEDALYGFFSSLQLDGDTPGVLNELLSEASRKA